MVLAKMGQRKASLKEGVSSQGMESQVVTYHASWREHCQSWPVSQVTIEKIRCREMRCLGPWAALGSGQVLDSRTQPLLTSIPWETSPCPLTSLTRQTPSFTSTIQRRRHTLSHTLSPAQGLVLEVAVPGFSPGPQTGCLLFSCGHSHSRYEAGQPAQGWQWGHGERVKPECWEGGVCRTRCLAGTRVPWCACDPGKCVTCHTHFSPWSPSSLRVQFTAFTSPVLPL